VCVVACGRLEMHGPRAFLPLHNRIRIDISAVSLFVSSSSGGAWIFRALVSNRGTRTTDDRLGISQIHARTSNQKGERFLEHHFWFRQPNLILQEMLIFRFWEFFVGFVAVFLNFHHLYI
jgi:hypothetical protein